MTSLEKPSNPFDSAKLMLALLLLVSGIVGFYYFDDYSQLIRVVGLLVIVAIAVAIGYQTSIGRSAWGFIGESRGEVRKVVWPTRTETLQTTLAVVIVVLIVGIFLWIVDTLLLWAVEYVTG